MVSIAFNAAGASAASAETVRGTVGSEAQPPSGRIKLRGWIPRVTNGTPGPCLEHFQRLGVQRRREFRVQGVERVAVQVDCQGRVILIDVVRPA